MQTINNLKFIGITDERDSCDCCGKVNLKRVVVFENLSGVFEFRGTSCALKAVKFLSKQMIKKSEKHLDLFNNGKLATWSESFNNIKKIKSI